MTCPHNAKELAQIVLGMRTCALENGCCPIKCVDSLSLRKVRQFFQSALPGLLADSNAGKGREELEQNLRQNLGVWYATSFLAGLNLVGERIDLKDRMKALANEAMQWYDDAFLVHVLVYLRGPNEERAEHYTAILGGEGDTEAAFEKFLVDLQSYVNVHGTTVRGDAHLKRVYGILTENDIGPLPLPEARSLEEGLQRFGAIQLPKKRSLIGKESEYGRVLLRNFRSLHRPEGKRYGQLHLAGGCDTQYQNERSSMGAVAHMYIAFKKEEERHHVYKHTMRAMLSRLAMLYALERLDQTTDQLQRNVDREKRTHERLLQQVRKLDNAINSVEDAARGVRAMIRQNPWEALKDWLQFINVLVDSKGQASICGERIMGNHDSWNEEHFAAAFLHLVSATDNEETTGRPLPEKWNFYRQYVAQKAVQESPIWRCLKRRGYIDLADLKQLCDEFDIWKDSLSNVRLDINQCSVNLLLWAIGAQPDEATVEKLTDKFVLKAPLSLSSVANGLNLLLESLLQHHSATGHELATTGQKLTRDSNISITVNMADDDLSLCFSPVLTADGPFQTITTEGFNSVSNRVKAIVQNNPKHPGFVSNNTSMGILSALGLDEGNWEKKIETIKFRSDSQKIQRESEGNVLSSVEFSGAENQLWVKYKRGN